MAQISFDFLSQGLTELPRLVLTLSPDSSQISHPPLSAAHVGGRIGLQHQAQA